MKLVDAHCHFDFPQFDGHRFSALDAALSNGIVGLVIPGVRRPDWGRVQETALAHSGLYYCLGIHPWFVDEHSIADLESLEQILGSRPERCVGIGECGLDRLRGDMSAQYPWFESQIELASKLGFPLIIHSVKAHDEVHATLKRGSWGGRALLHGFSGSYQQATKLVGQGCFIGVGGVITHPRARKTRDTVARLPLESLVLETDAPDMAPEGVEAGANSPVYLRRIFECLSEIRSEKPDLLASVLFANTQLLYGQSLW
ncbi:TatD DNase family protein [Marinobacter sp. LV10R510-11A]|uniref:TatD family hydrolase n=1 Tax=Marinobacter sp. LV10R510-11A TaxID=1415568 RepID=UPI000BB95098|nr:TatD family hydrolase [Marinobacter sp. LV10R510-11A]SOB76597.1 TatD DNase family protein [Marinobacter sp. LV10R510-11A]